MDEQTSVVQLGDAFNFTIEDLKANRARCITSRQKRIVWQRFWGMLLGGMGLLLMPPVVGWMLILWNTDQTLGDAIFDSAAVMAYIAGLLLSGFYVVVNFPKLLLALDTLRGRIQIVSGSVERYGRYLYVRKHRFLLEARTLDLIQTSLQYTFYILPSSRYILSVEFAE